MDSDRKRKKVAPPPPQKDQMSDTFALMKAFRANDEVESISSSTQEMTTFEERQLGRSFNVIHRTESPRQGGEFSTYYNPGFEGTEDNVTDGHDGQALRPSLRHRESDDSDDSDDYRFARARPALLKTTMDEGKEAGNVPMGSAESSFTRISAREQSSLGAFSDDMINSMEKLTSPANTTSWDHEPSSPDTSIHILPSETRQATPDATASRGQQILGGFGNQRAVNRPNLGATMRDQIKGFNTEQQNNTGNYSQNHGGAFTSLPLGPSSPTSPLGQTMRHEIRMHDRVQEQRPRRVPGTQEQTPGRVPGTQVSSSEHEKKMDEEDEGGRCWPRCILVGACLMILLAGIVTLIVQNPGSKIDSGSVRDDDILHQECPDVILDNLTDVIYINCTFDVKHDQRDWLAKEETASIHITFPNQSSYSTSKIWNGDYSWTFGPMQATCDMIGTYTVTLSNGHTDSPLTLTLDVSVRNLVLKSSIEQRYVNDTDDYSYFNVECSHSGDCTNYQIDIVGQNNVVEHPLNENRTCTSQYTVTGGATKSCRLSLPDKTVESFSRLKCKLTAGGTTVKDEVLRLPGCGLLRSCNVNCTEKSTDRQKIDSCQLSTDTMDQCFQAGRQIDSQCNLDENECSCKINWCQNNDRIYSNQHLGKLLCGEGYDSSTYTAYPTTTTSTSTTTTSTSTTTTSTSTSTSASTTTATTSTTTATTSR